MNDEDVQRWWNLESRILNMFYFSGFSIKLLSFIFVTITLSAHKLSCHFNRRFDQLVQLFSVPYIFVTSLNNFRGGSLGDGISATNLEGWQVWQDCHTTSIPALLLTDWLRRALLMAASIGQQEGVSNNRRVVNSRVSVESLAEF